MIRIKYQDSEHQYDQDNNPVTTWHEKCCEWIVNNEYIEDYENDNIDWWGKDNDFPRGISMERFIEKYGDPNKRPDISLEVYWNNESDWRKFTMDRFSSWNPNKDGIVSIFRSWGYLDYTKEKAISRLVTDKESYYHTICKFASGCKLLYNNEVIYEIK